MGATQNHNERHYMMRAIDLARRAEGFTSPNPMVGCVLVKDGRIVGEGFHARPGAAHAEAAALRAAGNDAAGATAYVTLEPCNHFGKTPPCAAALIKAGVARVVYAVSDPNPLAAGGAATLRDAGIETAQGLCEDEGRQLIRFWLHHISTGRPHVTAKFAASLDGKTATGRGDSKWITSAEARLRGHDLRHACDAIIVGMGTVLADDPALTARPELPAGRRDAAHPLRVVLDSTGRMPLDATMLRATTPGKTLIATTRQMPALKKTALENRGAEVLVLPADTHGRPDVAALLTTLGDRGLLSVMVEGGSTTLGSFFDRGIVNEVWAFIAPVIVGGTGPSPVGGTGPDLVADAFRLRNTTLEQIGDNILMRGDVIPPAKEASCSQAS